MASVNSSTLTHIVNRSHRNWRIKDTNSASSSKKHNVSLVKNGFHWRYGWNGRGRYRVRHGSKHGWKWWLDVSNLLKAQSQKWEWQRIRRRWRSNNWKNWWEPTRYLYRRTRCYKNCKLGSTKPFTSPWYRYSRSSGRFFIWFIKSSWWIWRRKWGWSWCNS